MRPRFPALLLAATIIAACAGSGDTARDDDPAPTLPSTAPESVPEPSDTQPPDTTPPDTTGVTAPDSVPGTEPPAPASVLTDVQSETSMVELLDSLPLAAYGAAVESAGQSIEVVLVDLDAASAAAGLDRPDSSDRRASIRWTFALTRSGVAGFKVPLPTLPGSPEFQNAAEIADELGFSILDVDQAAVVSAGTLEFGVYQGDDVQPSTDLTFLGGGIMSAGEGDDFTQQLLDGTAARRLGVPLRLAISDGGVAASPSTPIIESWLADEPTMLDAPNFAAAAAAFDSVGVASAYMVESAFGPFDAGATTSGFSEQFAAVGVGSTVSNGRAISVVVYVFADEAAASAVQPQIDDTWRSGTFELSQSVPTSLFFDIQAVELEGRAVVVTAAMQDDWTTDRARDLLLRGVAVFTNS